MPKNTAKRARAAKRGAATRKAPRKVSPVPPGYRTLTPHIILDDCAKAIDFYKKAFGAKEKLRMPSPDGKVPHAELMVGDSMVMMSDEMPPMPGYPGVQRSPRAAGLVTSGLFLYLKDVDAAFDRAIKAGCTVRQPPTDMFWGDRYAQVIDPFGHIWGMATHKEHLTPAQLGKRQQEFFAQMQGGGAA